MSSKIVLTIRSATLFWSSIFDEMESISSALVMKTPFPHRKNVGPGLYQEHPEQSIPTLTTSPRSDAHDRAGVSQVAGGRAGVVNPHPWCALIRLRTSGADDNSRVPSRSLRY